MVTRREFLDALAVGAAGLAIGTTAKSYSRILGSNDRLNVAVIGLNGRGYAHLAALKANKNAACIAYVCDVDSNILTNSAMPRSDEMDETAASGKDFRKHPRPERCRRHHHRHARPLAHADGDSGLQAGKHVYVEKPCSHNPAEGELLVRSSAEVRKAGADGQSAALFAVHHRDRAKNS